MDKIEKIRAEVERLKSRLLRGVCSSQVAMETICKEEAYNEVLAILDTMQEEPVSEDLEEEIQKTIYNHFFDLEGIVIIGSSLYATVEDMVYIAKHFANWQAEQFEKERLKHYNELTPEQAQIVSDFVTQHLKKNNYTPTFIDAIEYGKKLQKAQMIAKAIDVEVKVDAGGYPYIDKTIELYDYDKDVPLAKGGDNVKVIVIMED